VLPSFLFAATPWLWPSPTALIAVAAVHVVWLVVCDVVAPPVRSRPPPARPAGGQTLVHAATQPGAASTRPSAPPARQGDGFVPTPVLTVLDEADDIRTFRLARPEGFDFEAGQFLAVRVSVDGKPHVRCYSISSSPDTRAYLEISVRRQGLVSTTLHATLRSGSLLAIGRPAGQFVYPKGDDRPLALVAGGIGITPLLSMLRYAIASDPTRPVSLLYSARTLQAAAFLNELKVIAERHPQVRIGLTLSAGAAPPPWRTGRIDASMLRQYVAHPAHTIFCVCGPMSMTAAIEAMLLAEHVPAEQIRSERFETAVAASLVNTRTAVQLERGDASDDRSRAGWRVTFAASGRTATAAPSQTLLEVADAEGVQIPSSCRSGVCQACRTLLRQGDADCRSSVLDPADREAGYVLPCVTWATSDCVLEA
jgi:ferredoxin-NADP reductase